MNHDIDRQRAVTVDVVVDVLVSVIVPVDVLVDVLVSVIVTVDAVGVVRRHRSYAASGMIDYGDGVVPVHEHDNDNDNDNVDVSDNVETTPEATRPRGRGTS